MLAHLLAFTCLVIECGWANPDDLSLVQFGAKVKNQGHAQISLPQSPRLDLGLNSSTTLASPSAIVKTVEWNSFGVNTAEGKAWQAWLVGVVMLVALVLLISELFPPSVVMLIALCFVWNVGILTNTEALAGFSNSSLVVVGSMFLVVKGVDRSKLIDRSARSSLGAKTSQFVSLCRLCCITLFFGCFINNAPLVALFMPIIRDWARTREFAPSKFLIPLSYSSIGGGTLTLIGTSTNLVINGMMQDDCGESFGFFDPARVGILQNVFTMLYMVTLAQRFLPDEKGGLFRTLRERKEDMVTELEVQKNFPLVGALASEVTEALGIPKEALLKIFRQSDGRRKSKLTSQPAVLKRAVTEEQKFGRGARTPGLLRYQSSPQVQSPTNLSYMERTAHCWGVVAKRKRSYTDSQTFDELRGFQSRDGALSDSDMGGPSGELEPGRVTDLDNPGIREIFPIPEHEVVLSGDLLLLSLPRDACVDLVGSSRVSKLVHDSSDSRGTDETYTTVPSPQVGLRICDMDLLEIPGRQGEFVELVVSPSNPFVGVDFSGESRQAFEEYYQVAVLAVRQKTWAEGNEDRTKTDHLLSFANQRRSVRHLETNNSEDGHSVEHNISEVSDATGAPVTAAACTGSGLWQSEASPAEDGAAKSAEGLQTLRPGDAVLVLARAGSAGQQLKAQDFLAQTTVAQELDVAPPAFDYVPLVLFVIGVVLVATQQATMVQVSMVLAAVYLAFGWVSTQDLRDSIDWNMLVLIGSALGLAKAVQVSGLSGAVASILKNIHCGPRGTVFILYLFTMLITELVTNNAAAALAFPLAADLTRQMGFASVKPLAMTVMLATSACYVNPIGTAPNLMVMGPGGYTFKDFVKVGFLMDIICWVNAGIFVPVMWSMELAPLES